MTQTQLVNAVNKLAVGYNVNWDDIKYDADKAIYKINDRLGTKFPEMSRVLLAPEQHYAIIADGVMIPIFDDRWIVTIVIPFIAMEILARDEEFTTIYNKYNIDVEDNLYLMYSQEYNRINPIFIQDDTTGVFFTNEESAYAIHPEYKQFVPCKKTKPTIKLKLTCNVNNPELLLTDMTGLIPVYYDYDTEVSSITSPTVSAFSADGVFKWSFAGWYDDAYCTISTVLPFNMTSDREVFAKWTKVCVLGATTFTDTNLDYVGNSYATIGSNAKSPVISIPTFINGVQINDINFTSSNSFNSETHRVVFSPIIKHITKLGSFSGEIIEFAEIGSIDASTDDCIDFSTMPNVEKIYIHKAIAKLNWNSFNEPSTLTANRGVYIYCDYTEDEVKSLTSNSPFNLVDSNSYTRSKSWTIDNYTFTITFIFREE